MIEYVPAAIAAFNFLFGMTDSQQAPPQQIMQPAPGNPSLAMQAMSSAPMATYNPLMDDPMLMMMAQQSTAPPRGLLY